MGDSDRRRLSEAELAELRSLDAATRDRWQFDAHQRKLFCVSGAEDCLGGHVATFAVTPEGEFAKAARNALPRLIDEVRCARVAAAMLPPVARGDSVQLKREDYDRIRDLLGAT